MSYVNAGPITLTDTQTHDSPNDAVTTADLDNLVAEFDIDLDTDHESLYCYIGTVAGPDVFILRMKPDGTNLNFTFTEKYNYTDTILFTDSTIAYTTGSVVTVKITHDAANLYSVFVDDVLVDSATHSNDLTMGDGVFHLGYFGAVGTSVTTNINVSAVAAPAVTDVDSDEIIYKGQSTFETTVTGVPETVHSWGFRFDVSTEEATAISRAGDVFTFGITAAIQALADDEALDGTFWFRPQDYVAP